MQTYTMHQAKTQLSKLVAAAEAGEDVVITRGDTPVARLVPIEVREPERVYGALSKSLSVGPEFFEPLPAEELEAWESG